jgi:hypothetical protein
VLDADGIAQLVEKFFGLGEAGSGKVITFFTVGV